MNRRQFLKTAGGLPVAATAAIADAQAPSLVGTTAGEERSIEGIRLCWCPPGRFVMGSPASEPEHRWDEGPIHVTLTKGFWAGKFEVTQGEWRRIVGDFPGRPPTEEFGIGDDVPLYWVNYPAAERFCSHATEAARRSGSLSADWAFQLPTEAQWEYACRAGTPTATAFGAGLSPVQANFGKNIGRSAPVGRYPANAWNIHDMHGNVWEWCRDWYHAQLPGGVDPDLSGVQGVPNRDGTYSRVRRGGAWIEEAWACRSAVRLRYEPDRVSDHIGFRVFLMRI
jgi:formylglycine-generating enzyme required for sulfatase activity